MFKVLITTFFVISYLMIPNDTKASEKKIKIAVIDFQAVLDNSNANQTIKHTINTISENLQSKFRNEEKILKEREQKIISSKNEISDEEFQEAVMKFNYNVTEVQHEEKNQKHKLEQAYAEAINTINETILKIINDVAFEQEFDLILPTSQTLYANDNMNLTSEVLVRLNAKLPSLSLQF